VVNLITASNESRVASMKEGGYVSLHIAPPVKSIGLAEYGRWQEAVSVAEVTSLPVLRQWKNAALGGNFSSIQGSQRVPEGAATDTSLQTTAPGQSLAEAGTATNESGCLSPEYLRTRRAASQTSFT
jgi:hypothetical protein